jgi:hypothetical protein
VLFNMVDAPLHAPGFCGIIIQGNIYDFSRPPPEAAGLAAIPDAWQLIAGRE